MRWVLAPFMFVAVFLAACSGGSGSPEGDSDTAAGQDADVAAADEGEKDERDISDIHDEAVGEDTIAVDQTIVDEQADIAEPDDDLTDAEISDGDGDAAILLPPANAQFDYQLGGAYDPPVGVMVVARDRTATPVAGLYNICYVNGFQTQPDEANWWLTQHPDLILRDGNGDPVIDPDWPDEMLLDITTPQKRSAIAAIVGGWIAGCAADGYRAVEIDNLDTYSRSKGKITVEDAVAMIRLLADAAHAAGLAIGQKNAADLSSRRAETALDFVVAEECNQYDECGDYTASYGDLVFVIEYKDGPFQKGCLDFPQLSIIRRDLMLTVPGDPDYRYDAC